MAGAGHHYFRGIDELLDAVTQHLLDSVVPAGLGPGTGTPVRERVPRNVAAFLDIIEANRDVWLTDLAADTGPSSASPRLAPVREAPRTSSPITPTRSPTPRGRGCA